MKAKGKRKKAQGQRITPPRRLFAFFLSPFAL
jgi:hypothetical protein